ncbi:peptidase M23 [Flavobacterium cyanobacteriorum]|uniref:Peptidase M23 n=1 Tax=Flavobacterium cyanobacteriorum TaxID=2022802 RepID=A0A255YVN4_9FLAO|nr:peptidoglycan DD-metalloendopeptidase family protein [Flavobacterium cyanobacteriorum]OYQ33273.1 peptidase M23 [Flavobacterium cyanobacteriorum]
MARLFLTIVFTALAAVAWGQNEQQKKLEQRKAQIQKEIREFQELLSREKKKERSVLGEISEKQTKIKLNEKLINTTQKQTRLLNDDIYLNQLQVNKMNRELEALKQDYAEMLVKSYKAKSDHSRIMFILSSDNFLQAYKRMQYMKQYASFRKIQGDEIRAKMEQLEVLLQKLNAQKQEKQKLLTESEKQKQALEKEKREREELVKLIQKDKKKYMADIQKKQRETKEIDRQIERMIRAAIVAANKKTANSATTKKEAAEKAASTASNKIVLTREGRIVADNFTANKGKLPWPVEKGFISLGYGDQPHPLIKSGTVHNSGVEITTEPGASVRAVFGGEVTMIQLVAGHKAVYIQHGNYFTVYLNLASVNVSIGDKVSLKQNIGTVYTNPYSGKTIMKFMLHQNTTILNPQQWLSN